MDKFVVKGGNKLNGKVKISGAKNASLALIPATLLAPGIYNLANTPNLRDVWTMSRLMMALGAFCELNHNTLFIDTTNVNSVTAPYDYVKMMRASFYVLGPLTARYGEARVSLPGGCAWGPRPVDLHLKVMEALGAEITLEGGYIISKAERLHGARFHFDISSVGATGNAVMAAVLAKGSSIFTNSAAEPEITHLCRTLVKMGAKINGVGTDTLEIEGVDDLKAINFDNIPDRIEAATFLIAAAMTGGHIELSGVNPYHFAAVISKLEQAGCEIDCISDRIILTAPNGITPVDLITAPYPGLPTDIQPVWTAFMTTADGHSKIIDNIYHDRFKHVPELTRMGAMIDVVENTAIVEGNHQLKGAAVMATDLRAGAAMVLAGLTAEGTTDVHRIYHIDRGYEDFEKKLSSLGADIKREKTDLI